MDALKDQMRKIEAYCSHLERLAFTLPPPNSTTPELVSIAISIRNIAMEVQTGRHVDVPEGQAVMFAALDQITDHSALTPPLRKHPSYGQCCPWKISQHIRRR